MMTDVFIFATDTVYGLGAACDDCVAIDTLYRLKNRPASQPMQVLVADRAMAELLVHIDHTEPIDAQTRIYPARKNVSIDARLIADEGLGVRMPDHRALQNYIYGLGVPIAATSANLRGAPSIFQEDAVRKVFPDIPIVVTGDCGAGESSQIWDMRYESPRRLR